MTASVRRPKCGGGGGAGSVPLNPPLQIYDYTASTTGRLVLTQTGERLGRLAARYPRVLTECSIIRFQRWSTEAFVDVATRQLDDFDVDCSSDMKHQLCSGLAALHQHAIDMSDVCRRT